MGEEAGEKEKGWGSWEELLLACAVKRHGFNNWDSVSMELQTKTSLPPLLTTPHYCNQKYLDLKRRFHDHEHQHHLQHNDTPTPTPTLTLDEVNNIPWLEHLRMLRVQELKQELQRYDVSILSLQLKVKRLEEERGPILDNPNTDSQPPPDLHNQLKASQNNENQLSADPLKLSKRLVSSEESERDNRSVNESNSTDLSEKNGDGGDGDMLKTEAEGGGTGLGVQSDSKGVGEDSIDESSDELSSVSFGRRRKRKGRRRRRGPGEGEGEGEDEDEDEGIKAKSEPLIELLDMIRTHKTASLFEERRLRTLTQESNSYEEVVRQHMDIESIQRKVEQGAYSSSTALAFYRDLLLLFNNALVCYPSSSPESQTICQLRKIVSIHMEKKHDFSAEPEPLLEAEDSNKDEILERCDSLIGKHNSSSAPIIVCRKRSSVSAKPPSSSSSFPLKPACDGLKLPVVENNLSKMKKSPDIIQMGTRSSRRSNTTNNPPPTSTTTSTSKMNNKKPKTSSPMKQETPKLEKKKSNDAPSSSSAQDKKKSVVDFLKRIKKNSPVQCTSTSSRNGKGNNNNKGKEKVTRKSGNQKKQKPEESSPSGGKKNGGKPTKSNGGKRRREGGGQKEVLRQSKRVRR